MGKLVNKTVVFIAFFAILFSTSTFAQQKQSINGSVPEKVNGTKEVTINDLNLKGSGTESDPYLLVYARDLFELASFCSQGHGNLLEGIVFKLVRNIIFNAGADGDTITLDGINASNFIPIGGVERKLLTSPLTVNGHVTLYKYSPKNDDDYSFRGILDGGGYCIKNLHVRRRTDGTDNNYNLDNYYCGLFGRMKNTTIKNLIVANSTFSAYRCVGAFAGTIYNIGTDASTNTIDNCASVNNTLNGRGQVGSFVGSGGRNNIDKNNFSPTPLCTISNSYTNSKINKIDNSTAYGNQFGTIYGNNKTDNKNLSTWTITNSFYTSDWQGTATNSTWTNNFHTEGIPIDVSTRTTPNVHLDDLKAGSPLVAVGNWINDYALPLNDNYPIPGTSTEKPNTVTVSANNPITIPEGTIDFTNYPTTIAIEPGGSFINKTTHDFEGIVERKMIPTKWNVYGCCLKIDPALSTPVLGTTVGTLNVNSSEQHNELDMVAASWNYTTNSWNSEYLYANNNLSTGNAILVYPLSTTYNRTTHTSGGEEAKSSSFTIVRAEGAFLSNEANYTVTIPATGAGATSNGEIGATTGYWAMLANPYPASIYIDKFIAANSGKIQGNCVYKLAPVYGATTGDLFTSATNGTISLCDGFAVAKSTQGEISYTFEKEQIYIPGKNQSISSLKPISDMITIVTKSEQGVEQNAYFNVNKEANNGFDIWDAYVMSNSIENIITPYFLIGEKHILKDEVKTLPYETGFNLHTTKTQNAEILLKNIPEDIEVTLLDTINDTEVVLNENTAHLMLNEGDNDNQYVIRFTSKNVSIVDEPVENISISMYPNPAKENTTVYIEGLNNSYATVIVNDLQGRTLANYKVAKGNASVNINTSKFNSGVYYIRVITNKTVMSEQLIVE